MIVDAIAWWRWERNETKMLFLVKWGINDGEEKIYERQLVDSAKNRNAVRRITPDLLKLSRKVEQLVRRRFQQL